MTYASQRFGIATLAAAVLAVAFGTSCTRELRPPEGDPLQCEPGAIQSCPCPSGATGRQSCQDDGVWGPCQCADGGGSDVDPVEDAVDAGGGVDTTDGDASTDTDGGIPTDADDASNDTADSGGDQLDVELAESPPVHLSDDPQGISPRIDYSTMDQYYVAPDGGDGAAGTESDPWSVDAAESNAGAGDVVNFMDGTYDVGRIRPPSGNDGEPVVFRAENRHGAVVEGDGYTFTLEGTSHLHLQGFRIDAFDWVDVTNAESIVIRDNYMTGKIDGHTNLTITESNQVKVLNNVMTHGGNHNMFFVEDTNHVLVAGNSFSRAGHQPAGFFFDFSNVVWRGNVCHNVIGRNCGLVGGENVVLEESLVSSSWGSPKSGGPTGKFTVQNGIYRFNESYRNWGTPVTTTPYDTWNGPAGPLRVFNNVWARQKSGHSEHAAGYRLFDRLESYEAIRGTEFENNVFETRTSGEAGIYVVGTWHRDETDVDVTQNLFDGPTAVYQESTNYGLEEAENTYPETYFDNVAGDSGFDAPDSGDFTLTADSDARDAGTPLTRTVDGGSSRTVEVEDARYFHDGLGIDGVAADVVQIGDEIARIEEVDWEANTLTVDTDEPLSWSAEAPVGLPWSGEAPDMGAFQSGPGHARVNVEAPERADVGDEVTFEVDVAGRVDPVEICWQFGDGDGECGRSVSHTYDRPRDFAIRVRVVDDNNDVHWGTHYLFVSDEQTRTYSAEYRTAECRKFIGSDDC